MIKATVFTNSFLVATPTLADHNFSKSVIYIYEHSEKGAMGMIINKPLQISLGNVLEHLDITATEEKIANFPVLMGGPVNQEHGFILYDRHENEKEKHSKMRVSASKAMLKKIAEGNGPKDFIVTLGYSGWQRGQLEKEISRNDWLIAPFNRDILFSTPVNQRWEATAALIGIDINHLSDQIGHA